MRILVKRHPLLFFVLLAFLLSWGEWIYALLHQTPGGPDPLGVLAAAIIVTAFTGRANLKEFFARIFRWRVGIQWYALAFLLPVAICLLAMGANILLGAPVPTLEKLRDWPQLLGRFVFIFVLIGMGEEPGWRGFALPELQKKYSPLIASLILACIWALWHLPLMGTEFTLPIIPAFLMSLFAATFVMTWISDHTRSVLFPMILHTMVNTIGGGFLFPMFSGADLFRLWYVYAVLWAAVGVIVILTALRTADSQTHKLAFADKNKNGSNVLEFDFERN
jgi:membrane protease YdiL (CAAX protease family)